MKKIIVGLFTCCMLVNSYAQTESSAESKAERVQNKMSMQDHFNNYGVSDLTKTREHLKSVGIGEEMINPALRGMVRMFYALDKDENYTLDTGMNDYLTKRLRLTEEQAKVVFEDAKKIVYQHKNRTEDGSPK